jgi:hypothetical protein
MSGWRIAFSVEPLPSLTEQLRVGPFNMAAEFHGTLIGEVVHIEDDGRSAVLGEGTADAARAQKV